MVVKKTLFGCWSSAYQANLMRIKMNWIWANRIRYIRPKQTKVFAVASNYLWCKTKLLENKSLLGDIEIDDCVNFTGTKIKNLVANSWIDEIKSGEIPATSTTTVWNLRLTLLEFVVRYGTHIKLNRRTRTAHAQRHAHQYLLRWNRPNQTTRMWSKWELMNILRPFWWCKFVS